MFLCSFLSPMFPKAVQHCSSRGDAPGCSSRRETPKQAKECWKEGNLRRWHIRVTGCRSQQRLGPGPWGCRTSRQLWVKKAVVPWGSWPFLHRALRLPARSWRDLWQDVPGIFGHCRPWGWVSALQCGHLLWTIFLRACCIHMLLQLWFPVGLL